MKNFLTKLDLECILELICSFMIIPFTIIFYYILENYINMTELEIKAWFIIASICFGITFLYGICKFLLIPWINIIINFIKNLMTKNRD